MNKRKSKSFLEFLVLYAGENTLLACYTQILRVSRSYSYSRFSYSSHVFRILVKVTYSIQIHPPITGNEHSKYVIQHYLIVNPSGRSSIEVHSSSESSLNSIAKPYEKRFK